MKITIAGSPREIAALAMELQERQKAMELQERQKATDKSNKKIAVKPVCFDLGEVLLQDLEDISRKSQGIH